MGKPATVLEPDVKEEQPWLMSSDQFPERPDIVQMIRERSFIAADKPPPKVFKHTGKILFAKLKADPETCEAICWAIKLGMAAREVARRFGISPNSVIQIREAMDDRGELEAIGRRIDRLLNKVVEAGYEVVMEGAVTGAIHPGQLPIAILAADDKRRQRDAGMVVGTDRTKAAVTLESYLARVEMAKRLVSDCHSDAPPMKQAQITEVSTLDTGLDTAKALPEALPAALELVPSRLGDQAGGGIGRRPAAGMVDGKGREIPSPKAPPHALKISSAKGPLSPLMKWTQKSPPPSGRTLTSKPIPRSSSPC